MTSPVSLGLLPTLIRSARDLLYAYGMLYVQCGVMPQMLVAEVVHTYFHLGGRCEGLGKEGWIRKTSLLLVHR